MNCPSLHPCIRRLVIVIATVLVTACGGGSPDTTQFSSASLLATASSSPPPALAASVVTVRPRPALPISSPLIGVTVDSTSNLPAIIASLKSIDKVPTTRIVFDEFVSAASYRDATTKIRDVSYVMGEILDSFAMKQYSVQAYLDRTREYLGTLGDVVDIWEVGNEINGEWLGTTADVVAKMAGAYDQVKAQGKTAELTLYYNRGCWSNPSNEMFTWAQKNIPARMKQGLDYVLISYYEDDCNGLQPDWPQVFSQLHAMFPASKIGFGEVGTNKSARKAEYITRYYTKNIPVPNYVGGYFWWYFKQDMVPNTKALLVTLNNAINAAATPPAPTPPPTSPPLPPSPPPTTTGSIPLTADYWSTVYNGFGTVTYDANAGITLAPKASTSAGETHAALTLLKNSQPRNFRMRIVGITDQQLRQNTVPNPWETLWIFFNYTPTASGKNTSYFTLKPNGVELGTAYQELGQTFLQTGPASATAIGVSNTFDIEKIGNHITVAINGQTVTDFTGAIIDSPGSIGLYTEDARVRITNVSVTPLP